MVKKRNIGATTSIEVVYLPGVSSNNAAITNERHGALGDNSDEGSTKTTNERRDMLHNNSDEGIIAVSNERHDGLKNKSNEGSASITQDFEYVKEMEINKNSKTSDSRSDYLLENNSSQGSQHSRKSVVIVPRNSSRKENKVRKFNCKKGTREKERWEHSRHLLARNYQKIGMEDCNNSRNL